MPQMSPLNWLMLMLFFITIFLFFNILNYYLILYKNNFSSSIKKIKNLNWKW
uniref:ATP synthase complex subunit 8 n=1 Tax=Tenebrionoidea sp. 8 KM-2017 TaxID=2219486 RepID=A0A346RKA8_9CUCU|nr:ATP synthase F0 subunit 8 [Tenebrionoidea sp. 8 KM-2017]